MTSTLSAHHLAKAYGGRPVVKDVSLEVSAGEIVGLLGPNGAGKTTFLKTIMGEVDLDSGWVSVGETIQFGYYSQIANFRDENLTVVEFVREVESEASCLVGGFGGAGGMTAYTLLERFNFAGAKQMTKIRAIEAICPTPISAICASASAMKVFPEKGPVSRPSVKA